VALPPRGGVQPTDNRLLVHPLKAQIEAGILILGGLSVTGDDSEWFCLDGKNRWGRSNQMQFWIEQKSAKE
jgi:hypothetical protein